MISTLLIYILKGIRPLLGPAQCKFDLTCGNFAVLQLKEQPLHRALLAITKRLLLCSPLSLLFKKS